MKSFLRNWWVVFVWLACFILMLIVDPKDSMILVFGPIFVAIVVYAWRRASEGSGQQYHGDQDGN